ncbi:MAG: symmetrical bis(5'-nucleosyl)-tetraphosphatase [Pseudomonadales bacterium]
MATWAIGDLQGCFDSLKCLLKQIHFNIDKDQLWVAGDLVNRGPDSLNTLRYLFERRDNCRIVLGNHDLHMLAVAAGARKKNKKDTFADVLNATDSDTLLSWLQSQKLLQVDEEAKVAMVHAGIPPIWTIDEAKARAVEVEAVLHGPRAHVLFESMYGEQPDAWDDKAPEAIRLRTITNYFTRMRFCTLNGVLDLKDKSSIRSSRPGFLPWFEFDSLHLEDYQLVFGHWAALQGETGVKNIHALDTGCVWGGELTALNLQSGVREGCSCKN